MSTESASTVPLSQRLFLGTIRSAMALVGVASMTMAFLALSISVYKAFGQASLTASGLTQLQPALMVGAFLAIALFLGIAHYEFKKLHQVRSGRVVAMHTSKKARRNRYSLKIHGISPMGEMRSNWMRVSEAEYRTATIGGVYPAPPPSEES